MNMRLYAYCVTVLFFLTTSLCTATPPKFVTSEADITYHILLKLQDGAVVTPDVLNNITAQLNLPIQLQLLRPLAGDAYVVDMQASELKQVMKQSRLTKLQLFHQVLRRLNSTEAKQFIVYASEDHLIRLEEPAQRPSFKLSSILFPYHPLQWDEFLAPGGVELESAPGLKDMAWQLTQGSPSVVVAVIDSGIDPNDDLAANILPGWNFVTNTNNVKDITTACISDGVCHGTHVAGTVAAIGHNPDSTVTDLPIGMGPNLKIVPTNVFMSNGSTSDELLIKAMYWSVGVSVAGAPPNANPSKILNLSIGFRTPTACPSSVQDAINDINANTPALIIFASGNSNGPSIDYAYGNCTGILNVAATDNLGLRASYSNYGTKIDIAAPGGEHNYSPNGILSTTRSDMFIYIVGTSMAAPHVAGIAGLIYSYANSLGKTLTPSQVKALLIDNVSSFGESDNPDYNCSAESVKSCGAGIVNAFTSLKAVNNTDKAVFLPPVATQLNLKSFAGPVICQSGFLIPALLSNSQISVQDNGYKAAWQVLTTQCAQSSVFSTPILSQASGITLRYGNNNLFAFIPPTGLTCQVVNGSSVGCK